MRILEYLKDTGSTIKRLYRDAYATMDYLEYRLVSKIIITIPLILITPFGIILGIIVDTIEAILDRIT